MTIHPHGTGNRYRLNHCHCQPCRDAHAADMRNRRRAQAYGQWQGMQDATGTIRRVRALAAVGWSFRYLAARRGLNSGACAIRQLASGERRKVTPEVARAFVQIYDELCTSDGPSLRARTWARKRGWHGPEAWTDTTIDDPSAEPYKVMLVDEVLVQRAIDGNTEAVGALNTSERLEATRRLLRRDLNAGSISRRLGVSGATAKRLVQQAQQQEVAA